MLKYQKKGLCKALSMLLAVVMLLSATIGTMQAYALEDGQPTVTDVQGGLPLGTSEVTEPNEVVDSGTLLEPSPPADNDAPEATPSDAEETGLKHNPATPPNTDSVQSRGIAEIEVGTEEALKSALGSVQSGDTIKLTANIDYNDSITISKEVTFDVGQYILNIIATKYDYLTGLEVTGSVSLISTTGELNVTGSRIGVMVRNGEDVSATVTNATATQPNGIGIHATSVQPQTSSVVVKGNVNAPHTGVYAFGSGSTVTVRGNVNSTDVGAEAESDANIVVYGDIEAESCGAKIVTEGRIIVQKGIVATGADGTGAWITNAGRITVHDDISATNYIKFGNASSGETIKHKGDGVADTELPGFTKYTDANDRVVRVKEKKVPAVCTIGAQEFTSLSEAITAASEGETTIITLLQSITHNKPVEINGKSITFALGDFDLTIDTSAISNSTALWVLGDGKVSCTGSGKLHVVGSDKGVRASGGSELHISGNITARQYAVMAGSASDTFTPKVIVDGDVTVTGQGVNAWSEVEAVSVGGYAIVTIGGNVTANRTDEMQLVTAVYSNASTITIGKNVTTQGSGVNAQNGGNVTIEGALHYNPTGSGDQAYIKVGYPVISKTANDFEPNSIKPGYKEYKNGDNIVWVKEASDICTIGAQKFTSLDAAIASVPAGGRATITMLQSITHTKHIRVEKKTINLDLGDYTLLLDTSADGSYSPALMVIDGGKVNLIESGTGEFNIKSYMTAISVGGIDSKATVHNVVAGDSNGVYMVGSGDDLASSSTVTVLGSITVGNGNGVEVNARGGRISVGGEIRAGRIGVYVWSNPGTYVTVKGDITVDSFASIAGIRAYGDTNVDVTGNVTVRGNNPESNCVGVHASGSIIKVDGNVASSGMGAQSDSKGKVEITGSLTAGTPFITVGTADMTADQGIRTPEGFLLYTYDYNTVQIGSIGVTKPVYTITVQNDGHGTGSASPSSAEAGTEIILTATPNSGYYFKEWQVVSGGLTIVNNKFNMPAENVVIRAIFEAIPVTNHTVTFNLNGGTRTGGGELTQTVSKGGSAIEPTVTRSGYTFTGWDKAFTNITQSLTVTARWSYNGGGSGNGDGGNNDHTPVDKNRDKKDKTKKTVEIINGIIILDIDKDIFDENKLVPYFINNRNEIIVKVSAILDGNMHLIGNSTTDYLLRDNKKYFTDISGHWAKGDINFVTAREFFDGIGNDKFAPDSHMTRAMIVTALGKLWSADVSGFKTPRFIDVEVDKSYASYVEWAAENGIIKGIGNNCFAPERFITREEIAVIIANFIKFTNLRLNKSEDIVPVFADYNIISDWAKESIRTIQDSGIISGKPGKVFDPKGMATRAEVAVILKKFVANIVK